jgi:hypothetical protein
MSKFIDLTGQRFELLVAVARVGRSRSGEALWLCACDCGGTTTALASNLRRGHTRSCGCRKVQGPARAASLSHGMARHPLYNTFIQMHSRCENPDHKDYAIYGGRGVKVCGRWSTPAVWIADIESSIGPRPANPSWWKSTRPYYTLDRIDVYGDYEPGNIRWATSKEQTANRRKIPG